MGLMTTRIRSLVKFCCAAIPRSSANASTTDIFLRTRKISRIYFPPNCLLSGCVPIGSDANKRRGELPVAAQGYLDGVLGLGWSVRNGVTGSPSLLKRLHTGLSAQA